ncbi:MAG: GIY-YIG nuclease family protein [Candidatus Omnitrophota bacterium]
MNMWYVYILRCKDGSFYTGSSNNVNNRLQQHNSGKASKYTRSRRPVTLLYIEQFATKVEALRREIKIKDFSTVNKKKLIEYGLGQRFPSALEA